MKYSFRCVPLGTLLKDTTKKKILPLTNRQITQAMSGERVVGPRQTAFNRARTLSNTSCRVHYKMPCCGQYATKTDFEYQVTRLVCNLSVSCPLCQKKTPLTAAQLTCLSPFVFQMHWKCYNRYTKQEIVQTAPISQLTNTGCPCGAQEQLLDFEERIWHKSSPKMTCCCGQTYTLSDATLSQLDPVIRRKYNELCFFVKTNKPE